MARVKPHIKVHLSVPNHRKTSAVWADVRTRGMLVELWRQAGEKFAGKTANRVVLKPTDRMEIAGTTNQAEADQAVTALCSAMRYELRKYPNRWEAKVRKFSEKQGYEVKEREQLTAEKVQRTPASESDTEYDSNTDSKDERKSAARTRRSRATLVPDSLSEADAESVMNWARGQNPPITPEMLTFAWSAYASKAKARGYAYVDHAAAFRNALGASGEAWALKGYGSNPTGEAESPAQAKARRTKEAGAKAYEMIQASKQQLGLVQIEGGRR